MKLPTPSREKSAAPAVPSLVARLFVEAPLQARRRLVACLLATAGPLAIASLADGRFARLLLSPAPSGFRIPLEDVRRLTEGQILALANYAWQACPAVFTRVVDILRTENPLLLQGITGALLLYAMGERAQRNALKRKSLAS